MHPFRKIMIIQVIISSFHLKKRETLIRSNKLSKRRRHVNKLFLMKISCIARIQLPQNNKKNLFRQKFKILLLMILILFSEFQFLIPNNHSNFRVLNQYPILRNSLNNNRVNSMTVKLSVQDHIIIAIL